MNAGIIFSPLSGEIFHSGGFRIDVLVRMALGAISFLFWAGSTAGTIFLIHFFLTLPMRRAECARLFLDLLEGALNRSQSIEEMILSVAQSRDRAVGVRFHLLAAYIESGLRTVAALEKVPRFLPPQIAAMFRAGEKLGDLKKVLPACREILRDRPAGVRSAVHYMILVVLFFSPVFVFVVMMTAVYTIPKFREVAAGSNAKLWPETLFVFGHTGWLIGFELLIFLLLALVTLIYIAGPQFVRRFQFRGLPFVDWIAWHIPWKQKRLQRTFSAMLAVLIDGGVLEAEAVRLAGDCTANEICRRRSQRVVAALEKGIKLDEAVRAFDDSGEFHWRLTNATHARGGFLNALGGWHEALDARAFQQEEATAHVVTSGIVILNGLLVALIATAMFGMLVAIMNGVLLL
ncbi:MAG: type II secretion system F family protein [Verrucomicrobiota bacterium]|jgi:type II secretory pathway component PulF